MRLLLINKEMIMLTGIILSTSLSMVKAQSLYIDNGGVFSLGKSIDFTTSSSLINHHNDGTFYVEADCSWGTATEYVNGVINIFGAGSTVVNIGDQEQSTVKITTQSSDVIKCDYTKSSPTGDLASDLVGYKLSDTEFWTVEKVSGVSTDVSVSELVVNASATYGGDLPAGALELVRYNTTTLKWEKYSGSPGFGKFAYAADQSSLNIDSSSKSPLGIYPNPVSSGQFLYVYTRSENDHISDIKLYNVYGEYLGELTYSFTNNKGEISLPNYPTGVYFLRYKTKSSLLQQGQKIIIK